MIIRLKKRAVARGLAAGMAALVYACTMRDVTDVPVTSVVVQPSSVSVLEGETHRFTAQAKDGLGNNLPTGALTWSSDDASVFSISSNGTGEALSAGETRIWANLEGTRGSATVLVEPGPRLVVDRESVSFFGNVGGEAPAPVTLSITNGGGGTLGGISGAVEYPQGETAGWLSLALAGTSAPTTLTLSVLVSLLGEGTHEADVVLISQEARNSPIRVPVQAVVTLDQPIIELSPADLQFQVPAGGNPPPAQVIQVTNVGGGVLSNLRAEALYIDVGGWLSVDMTGSTAPAEIIVQPQPGDLGLGSYGAEIRVTGEGALNSPRSAGVTLTVETGSASPGNSTATVPDGTAGIATGILVQARDAQGNLLDTGGENVQVSVSGANTVATFAAVDNGDGTYSARYTPVNAGTDRVAITMNGTAISGSPFTSSVSPGNASPSSSTAIVPNGAAGSRTDIVVQARDSEGNRVSVGGETVEISVSGTNNEGALTVTDEGDGTYTAGYVPTAVGTDNVAITMNGTPISGSPYTSVVGTGAASPANSTASVPQGTAGTPTEVVVQARDSGGNTLGSGGESVEVTISGANVAAGFAATDNGDGTYSASYTPTVAGIDSVGITMNGTPISGSPYISEVSAGVVDPSSSTATVPGGTVGTATVMVVQGRDKIAHYRCVASQRYYQN
ncbi:MAG: filamin/ABP280 repeat domain-containing protein [Longimicrobiales bacterium]